MCSQKLYRGAGRTRGNITAKLFIWRKYVGGLIQHKSVSSFAKERETINKKHASSPLITVVPRFFEDKREDIVFGFPSFHQSIVPSLHPFQEVGTLCMQILLHFYADSFEVYRCLGYGLKICIFFGYNPQIIYDIFSQN